MPGSAVPGAWTVGEQPRRCRTEDRRADDRSGRRRGVEPVAGRDDLGDGTRRCGQQEIDVRLRDGAGRRVVRDDEELRRRLGHRRRGRRGRVPRGARSSNIAPGSRPDRRLSRRAFGRGSYTHGMDVYVDLVRYRELFGSLFRRDFRARYKGSVLGVAWSLANPLILMGVYLLLFSVLWQVVQSIDHYPLYLLSGLTVWVFFATSLQQASRSMVDYSELIRKVRFPRQLVAFSTVATQLVAFGAMFVVLFVIDLIVLPRVRGVMWTAIPLAVLIVGLVAGLALAIASANVIFRDVEHLVSAALLPWFFLTPVLWTFDQFNGHPTLQEILRWGNPITPPIEAIRAPLYCGHAAALDRRALHDRRHGRRARLRRLGLQSRRRPHRRRALPAADRPVCS